MATCRFCLVCLLNLTVLILFGFWQQSALAKCWAVIIAPGPATWFCDWLEPAIQVILRAKAAAACRDVANCCIRCTLWAALPLENQLCARACVCVYLCVHGHRRVTELLSTRSPMSCTNKLPPLYLKCACCHILNIVNNSTHAVSSVVASIYIVQAGSRPLLKSCFLFFSHTLDDSQTHKTRRKRPQFQF